MKKNLITVLKKLLAAFGGEETNSNNAVEVIDKIADSVEQGGGSSGDIFVVHDNDGTLDKTYSELEAISKNKIILLYVFDDNVAALWFGNHFYYNNRFDRYVIEFMSLVNSGLPQSYSAQSATDYPSKQ